MLIKGDNHLDKTAIAAILLVQLGDIGDVVLTFPTISALREAFPGARIVVCVREKARELISCCPEADGVIAVEKRRRGLLGELAYQHRFVRELRSHGFDLAVELRGADRGAIISRLSGAGIRIGRLADDKSLFRNSLYTHIVDPDGARERESYAVEQGLNILAPFGIGTKRKTPRLANPPEFQERLGRVMKEAGVPDDRPLVVIHAFSLWKYKEWRTEQWAALVDHIGANHQVTMVLTGAPDERPQAKKLQELAKTRTYNLAGMTSIGELAALMHKSVLYIGVDTGAMHIAAAAGTPTISIFGPSPAVVWAPRGDEHLVITKDMPCVPCRDKGCGRTEFSRCLHELEFAEIRDVVNDHLIRTLPG